MADKRKMVSARNSPSEPETPFGRRLAGEASWVIGGQLISGLVLLAGTRLITEMVPPDTFGQVALVNGVVALLVAVFAYPFISAGMRLLPDWRERGAGAYLYPIIGRMTFRSASVSLCLLLAVGSWYANTKSIDPWLFPAASVLLAVTVFRELGVHLAIGARRQRDASLWQTTDSLLRPILAIAAIALCGALPVPILLGYALATSSAGLLWSVVQRQSGRRLSQGDLAGRRGLTGEVFRYALPLVPVELLAWFSGLGDRYIIGYYMTAADVGVYAASYTLINEAFQRSASILMRTFQPVYFQHCSRRESRQARQVFRLWLLLMVGMGITGVAALVLVKDVVAKLLLAQSYYSGAALMPIIGAGCAIQALGTVLAQRLFAVKSTQAVLAGRACGALTAVVAIPLMVQWQGMLGAAMAAPLYFGVEAMSMALLGRKLGFRPVLSSRQPCPVAES